MDRLDLGDEFGLLPKKSEILDMLKLFVGKGSVYQVMESFLSLMIITWTDLCHSIPPAGEISKVLFNIVFKEIFDRDKKLSWDFI